MSEQIIERVMGEACANCHGSGVGMDGSACPFAPHKDVTYKVKTTKIEPGSETHFAMLGAEFGYNFLGGHEYTYMQQFAKKVWDAALATQPQAPQGDVIAEQVANDIAAWAMDGSRPDEWKMREWETKLRGRTGSQKPLAQLLTDAEAKSLQELSEAIWADLQKNELGGYSGINRPFYLLWNFKTVIERYGRRDVGLQHSKNALDEAFERGKSAAVPRSPMAPLTEERIEEIWKAHVLPGIHDRQKFYSPHLFARQIEAAHGISAAPETPEGKK